MAVTFNPADKSVRITLSNGDLTATGDGTTNSQCVRATEYKSTGKWYYEITINTVGSSNGIGLANASFAVTSGMGDANSAIYRQDGACIHNSSNYATISTFTTGDIIGVLFDADANTVRYSKNGTLLGSTRALADVAWAPCIHFFSTAPQDTANFGATPFNSLPSGYEGYDSPPTTGTAAVTMEALDGEGSRVSLGSAVLEAMTGVGGHNGLGVAVLEALQVAASGGSYFGDVVFSPFTAEATGHQASMGAVVLEALTGSGTGLAGEVASSSAYMQMRPFEGIGQASSASVGNAAVEMEVMTGDARGPQTTNIVLEALTAAATGSTGVVGSAALVLQAMQAAATGSGVGRGYGAGILAQFTGLGAGKATGFGSGAATLYKIQGLGHGGAGTVGRAAVILKALDAAGTRAVPTTGSAAVTFEYLRAYGRGALPAASAYRTWSVNLGVEETTEYDAHSFNSATEFAGGYYAAGAEGVVLLDGDNDDGTEISWTFKTGFLDDGKPSLKHLKEVLLALRYNGPLTVRVWTNEESYYDYEVDNYKVDLLTQIRAKLGRGPRSRFYMIEILGAGDTYAEIHTMQLPMVPLRRRIG